MWNLTIRSSKGEPTEYTLKPGKNTIGRQSDNAIVIYDTAASRMHAVIDYNPDTEKVVIKDLNSTNGTFVNRQRIHVPYELRHKDIIRIGENVISVMFFNSANQTAPKKKADTRLFTRELVLESLDNHAVLMYEVAEQLNTVLDIDTALTKVSTLIRRAMGADRCEVVLAEEFNRLDSLGLSTSILNSAIQKKETVIIPDMSLLPKHEISESASLLEIRSVMCVPIVDQETVIGLIYLHKTNPHSRPFNSKDMELAVAISHQASLTIQRTHLIQQVQEEQSIREKLQRLLSPQEADFLVNDYLKTGHLPELAEKKVTVLFADIADSTGMAERLGPSKFGHLLSDYFGYMTKIVFNYGGLLEKFLGDGIMAVFGLSEDRPDPEGRAISAGLAMLENVMDKNKVSPDKVTIGVGVNTGPVMAGYLGTEQRVEFAVLGDTVNVAHRLQSLARPNRLLTAPETIAYIVGRFKTQRIGETTVKGRTKPIQVHEVLRL